MSRAQRRAVYRPKLGAGPAGGGLGTRTGWQGSGTGCWGPGPTERCPVPGDGIWSEAPRAWPSGRGACYRRGQRDPGRRRACLRCASLGGGVVGRLGAMPGGGSGADPVAGTASPEVPGNVSAPAPLFLVTAVVVCGSVSCVWNRGAVPAITRLLVLWRRDTSRHDIAGGARDRRRAAAVPSYDTLTPRCMARARPCVTCSGTVAQAARAGRPRITPPDP